MAAAADIHDVLVIDDDAVIRMIVRDTLESVGITVHEAADADQGLAQASALRPQVIILDVMLPRVDGLSLLGVLRELDPGVQVLVFSATGSRNAERAAELGAASYMAKPFELRDLVARVQSLLPRAA